MSEISFDGRVAVITGAGGGLGRTYALEIARRGGAVVVNDLGDRVEGTSDGEQHGATGTDAKMADAVVAEITAAGGRAVASHDNVASREGARRIVETALDSFGRIDTLINNAGNMRLAPFEDFTEADLQALLSVHLGGAFNVTQAAWPQMKLQAYGRVLFTASSAGMYGDAMYAGYGSAKAGLVGLMNVIACEGKSHGIFCNTLMPTAFSRMTDNVQARMAELAGAGSANGAQQSASSRMALVGNAMNPEFSTGLAVFLASEACTSTKGIYSSCAGRMARVFIGAGEGWHGSRETPASAEDIAAHFREINDLSGGAHIPASPGDEFRIVLARPQPTVGNPDYHRQGES